MHGARGAQARRWAELKITATIEIASSPERVFYWLEDPERTKAWMTSVTGYEILNKTEDWTGTTFVETVADEGGSTVMRGVVTGFVANERFSVHLEGDYNSVDVEFRVEGVGGMTRVCQRARIRFKSLARLVMLFAGPLFKKKIVRQCEAELAALKRLCEGEVAPSSVPVPEPGAQEIAGGYTGWIREPGGQWEDMIGLVRVDLTPSDAGNLLTVKTIEFGEWTGRLDRSGSAAHGSTGQQGTTFALEREREHDSGRQRLRGCILDEDGGTIYEVLFDKDGD